MVRGSFTRFDVGLAITCALLACDASQAFGWGEEGHIVVAAIAQQHLTPEASAAIQQLLGSSHIYDSDIANWADAIRVTRHETAPWHFVDIPISADTYDANRDGEDHNCVIDKIEDFRQVLADRTASRADRIEALKFVVHFVGDIHQPLHCESDNDRGGNQIRVRYPGRPNPTNLHAVWDSAIIQDAMGDQSVTDYAESLEGTITTDMETEWLNLAQPSDWANESHAAAQKVYSELVSRTGLLHLPANYGAEHKDVVQMQLKRGGLRLAALLNQVFASEPAATASNGSSAADRPTALPSGQVIHRTREQRLHLTARAVRT